MEDAVTLAESMDSRGHGRGRRTRYRPQPWTPGAVTVVVSALVAAAVFLSASFSGTGGLHPSTFPLTWPEADPCCSRRSACSPCLPSCPGRRRCTEVAGPVHSEDGVEVSR